MKSPVLTFFVIYLCVISLIAVIVTVADKVKAKRGKWRVPEATLLLISAMGGSVAMYVTMHTIRHKTKHIKFMLGIPLILVFQLVILWWCFTRFGVL
ncbi:MAG: DUF1294 domain-containing protein [Clostridia bacterium]|nr:DUF1294 domain-containing protein [Clostridia bacterium]MBQ8370900.1 DUF1294 domain-containing protein [Clostridia bacterium]MBQ8512864.1 DUF1294 domain-containing protein [Clostridia bacterium]